MDLIELIRALSACLPDADEEPCPTGHTCWAIPLMGAETGHRQYEIIGIRRNSMGDVVLRLAVIG